MSLLTNKVYCSFWEEYKQSSRAIRLFTFLPETAVHFICKRSFSSNILNLVTKEKLTRLFRSQTKSYFLS